MPPRRKVKCKPRPEIGTIIVAHLPFECLRATVLAHPEDPNTIQVALNVQAPLSKAHNFRYKQKVTLVRGQNMLKQEVWGVEED